MKALHIFAHQYARAGFRGSELLWRVISKFSPWPREKQIVTLPDGFSFEFNLKEWTSHSIYKGQYELELEKLMKLLEYDNRNIVIDVGANIGRIGFLLAKDMDETSTLVAFEPLSNLSLQLARNLVNLRSRVQVHNMAIGAINESRLIAKPNAVYHSGLATLRNVSIEDCIGSEVVEVKKLDDILNYKTLKIAVLKIDVEGWEPQVLEGAKNLMEQSAPKYVILEFTPSWYSDPKHLFDLMSCYHSFVLNLSGILRKKLTKDPIDWQSLKNTTEQCLLLFVLKDT